MFKGLKVHNAHSKLASPISGKDDIGQGLWGGEGLETGGVTAIVPISKERRVHPLMTFVDKRQNVIDPGNYLESVSVSMVTRYTQ